MRYGEIKETDIANGEGVRVSLFVSGCRNRCKGCFNPETWSFDYGEEYTTKTLDKIIKLLDRSYISGLSILGGDPFEPENLKEVTTLIRLVKFLFQDKTVWVYTGYLYEDLKDLEVMDLIDVLVDGRFIEDQKDISLQFRGSRNQRIIDVQKTKRSGSVNLWRCAYEKNRT